MRKVQFLPINGIVAPSVVGLVSDGNQQGTTDSAAFDAVLPETPGGDDNSLADRNTLPKPPDRSPPSRDQIETMIARLAILHRFDFNLVHAVIRAESGYNVHAVSSAGAVGLVQVMPATASDYGVDAVDAQFDPSTNLDAGMRHLKRLLDKYGGIGQAVMAYNAGEGALARGGRFVSYPETQRCTHAVVVSNLRKIGIQPYTSKAQQVIGFDFPPDADPCSRSQSTVILTGRAPIPSFLAIGKSLYTPSCPVVQSVLRQNSRSIGIPMHEAVDERQRNDADVQPK